MAAKIQSEPEDGTVLSEVEPWQQSLSAQTVSVITIEQALGARGEIEPVRTLEERLFEDTCDWCGRRC